jgi:alcohol dehydrogenase, propanol-preferring
MGLRVVVVDTGAERKALCKKFGAEHFVDFKETDDTAAEVVKVTDGGAHAVFVTGMLMDLSRQGMTNVILAVQSYPISLQYLGGRIGGQVMWYASGMSVFLVKG